MKTSIHFKEVKTNSEAHNNRTVNLDYVRSDLSYLNQNWSIDSIKNRRENIEEYCKIKSGRKLQKNAMPIKEAVVVMKENTTMEDVHLLIKKMEEEIGIRTFQASLHFDEGHYDKSSNEWMPNYHLHLVSDFQDRETGKTLKLKPFHFSMMQDICAQTLKMERGVKSSKTHIESAKYKIIKLEEEYQALLKQMEVDKIAFQKFNLINQKLNPDFERYDKMRKSFPDWYEYEQFLKNNPHKSGSFFWFDYIIYVELNEFDLQDLFTHFGIDKMKVYDMYQKPNTSGVFTPEIDEIRKELVSYAEKIDFKVIHQRIHELRYGKNEGLTLY